MLRFTRIIVLLLFALGHACAEQAALMPIPTQGLFEVRSAQPSIDYHWVVGHYRWESGRKEYVWVRGRWEKVVPDHRWIKGRYRTVSRDDLRVKQWTPGRWVERRRSAAPDLDEVLREINSKGRDQPRTEGE